MVWMVGSKNAFGHGAPAKDGVGRLKRRLRIFLSCAITSDGGLGQ